ncbi:MAG: molybdopterin-binding protein [Lachnospiraceae bacterium]|nr:molybdopterin-binding protein [Lachnospiraceae bacterium]
MKLVKTEEAVGHVLCHDITQIIPGKKKGPVFKKGHVVTDEDIPVLLSVGKESLYIWEKQEGMLHEDEAALILCDICTGDSKDFTASEPSEGKITISAAVDGLLKIDTERLKAVNSLGQMMIATVHGNFPVKKGDKLAGTRIIPLVIEEEKMDRAVSLVKDSPLMRILPFKEIKAGIVTTGNEVAKGLIKDAFGPVLKSKLSEYSVPVMGQKILSDDAEGITEAIMRFAREGADMVLVSGGMSVDPDDRTPKAIKDTGADIISYGAPTLPGAMFLLSYLEHEGRTIPVLGLPGCVMYARRTVFDLVLPRVLAGERLTADDLTSYGEGGMCLSCEECHFPNCGFGK